MFYLSYLKYTCIYMHIHTYTYIHIHTHTYTYIYIHIHTYTYIYIHIHTYTYIYIHNIHNIHLQTCRCVYIYSNVFKLYLIESGTLVDRKSASLPALASKTTQKSSTAARPALA